MARVRAIRSWLTLCALCLVLSACDGLFIMHKRVEITDGQREPSGMGCMQVLDGSNRSGGGILEPEGELNISEGERDGMHEVVMTSQGEELSRRAYSEKFLHSHERDTFTVTTAGGRVFENTYWGGEECEHQQIGE